MILLYVLIAALVGIITIVCCRFFTRNENISNIAVIANVAASIIITKMFILPIYLYETFEVTLKKNNPIFSLIAEKYPIEFNNYVSHIKTIILRNKNSQDRIYYDMSLINTVFIKSLPTASNQSIYHFYQEELKVDKKLLQIDPELVLFMEFSNKFENKPNPDMISFLAGDQIVKSAAIAKEAVIISSIKAPQPPLTKEQREKALLMINEIMHNLINIYGKSALSHVSTLNPKDPTLNKKLAAEIIISFYEEILKTGEESAGLIFRYLALSRNT